MNLGFKEAKRATGVLCDILHSVCDPFPRGAPPQPRGLGPPPCGGRGRATCPRALGLLALGGVSAPRASEESGRCFRRTVPSVTVVLTEGGVSA